MAGLTAQYEARAKADELADDAAQRQVLGLLQRITDDLCAPQKRGLLRKKADPVRGLYLWGGVGRGKSMLVDMFADAVDVPHRRVHFHSFMQEVHEAMHRARQESVDDPLRPFLDEVGRQIRMLAFDEMQIGDITDAMIVGRLFRGLAERGVTIVTTSNRPPGELYENGLNRQLFLPFIAFLCEEFDVHELTSPVDYRQNLLAEAQVYFSPITAAARRAIDAIWADLTGGMSAPLTLEVKGRAVTLPAFRNGVARASFFDLCGQPLGLPDYLAIAAAVRVLVLDAIPCLSRSNFNEAKRFVTLIDALYEARVRLIASAEARPDMLYLEGEGTFEFARTASRLVEMQSADWGGSA